MCDETSAEVNNLCSERDSAAASHHELLAAICRAVKVREERKDKATEILVKLRKIYHYGRKVTVEPHVVECRNL